jgi:hypothetical protein
MRIFNGKNRFKGSLTSWFSSHAEILIISLGIVFRFKEYFENHSLWLDEASTAFKLVSFPLVSLCHLEGSTLDLMHAYPVLFLKTIKIFIWFLGNHELSMRFFPLISGITALFFFAVISRKTLSRPWALFSLAAFAFSPQLIYYSAILKPYSSDVMIFLFLGILSYKLPSIPLGFSKTVFIAVAVAACLLCSFPAFFAVVSLMPRFLALRALGIRAN